MRITLVKSVYGQLHRHRATARGLGLRRLNQTVVVTDSPENRGMVNASRHLFRVEEV
jgi:large subunit ribosomal protein L30